MKSAEAYPEYQGDSDNIQFLSKPEHQKAHGVDYRNPTNGYYDPVTKITRGFGENKHEPCQIIELSNPIVITSEVQQELIEKKDKLVNEDKENISNKGMEETPLAKKARTPVPPTVKPPSKSSSGFGKRITEADKVVGVFFKKHPILTGVLKTAGIMTVTVGVEVVKNKSKLMREEIGSTSSEDNSMVLVSSDDYDKSSFSINYPNDRLSPKRHTVQEHSQRYHTKNGVITKEKKAYQSPKSDEE